MYCKIIVMGRLTADPELRHTPSNVPVTSFSVAVNRSYVTKSGDRQTDFFNLVAWRGQAEFICKYFKKGNCILVDGRLENRDYIDKNGAKQRVSEIIVENVSFTGEPKSTSYGNDNGQSYNNDFPNQVNSTSNAFENMEPSSFEEIEDDDDLPF